MDFVYQDKIIEDLLQKLGNLFENFLRIKNKFQASNSIDLPICPPKPHTRKVSWLAEEVIMQNLMNLKGELGLEFVQEPPSDIGPYDCYMKFIDSEFPIFINFKVSYLYKTTTKGTKVEKSGTVTNDISEITQLFDFFLTEEIPLIFEVIFIIDFVEYDVKLNAKDPLIFFLPWLSKYKINKSQHKVQAPYIHENNKISPHHFLVDLLVAAFNPERNVFIKWATFQRLVKYASCKSMPSEIVDRIDRFQEKFSSYQLRYQDKDELYSKLSADLKEFQKIIPIRSFPKKDINSMP
ncbi:hypothetical protein [Candidatus Lokiarchaeum ossiferum]|uniref:hypothetical protein n=1 Tax=Candidatus Lokiarchaeum ossiferum TaxID=2951803 RepID=UPI00352F536E